MPQALWDFANKQTAWRQGATTSVTTSIGAFETRKITAILLQNCYFAKDSPTSSITLLKVTVGTLRRS